MADKHIEGLVAATFSPMTKDNKVDASIIPAMVEYLIRNEVKGIFVCGSTGEGPSLTTAERKILTEAFIDAVDRRIKVFVHVGHNSVEEARDLAAHAQQSGADYISATPPSYFKIGNVPSLISCLSEIASGAPELPFYYYNIPHLTGVALDMVEFLKQADNRIPNLAGIKYTTPLIHEYQACLNDNKKFDVFYGTDEMLLSALSVGAKAFIGSTYNFAAPVYNKLLQAFHQKDIEKAAEMQWLSVRLVRIINKYGGLAAQKEMMKLKLDCGPVRSPLRSLSLTEIKSMEQELQQLGFFDW